MTVFKGMQGVQRVWPEMPTSVAHDADEALAHDDLEGMLCVIRDWEMTLRAEATKRWLDAQSGPKPIDVSEAEVKSVVGEHFFLRSERKHQEVADLVMCPRCGASKGQMCWNVGDLKAQMLRPRTTKNPHEERLWALPRAARDKYNWE